MSRLVLRPNVGAEEPGGPQVAAARRLGRAWRLLFPAAAEWPEGDAPAGPDILGRRDDAAFPWLPDTGLCAWWNDRESAEAAARGGLALCGPDPEIVARVHDKAFSARVARREGVDPRWLRERIRVFDPEELADSAAFRETLRSALADWPEDLASTATLKPRLGTSGRGRVRAHEPDAPALAGALPRLAARGGAVLEPWLERTADYSVQLHLARDGVLTLLGTLSLSVSASGVYRGHRGELDHRGRVVCGADLDDRLIEAASTLAHAAHDEGYFGPCGVDAFVFRRGEEEVLRPLVELNARFTAGIVGLGMLRRLRPWLDEKVPPAPGERRSFAFGIDEADAPPLPGATAIAPLRAGGVRLAVASGPLPAMRKQSAAPAAPGRSRPS